MGLFCFQFENKKQPLSDKLLETGIIQQNNVSKNHVLVCKKKENP